jgi:hypothetical protein
MTQTFYDAPHFTYSHTPLNIVDSEALLVLLRVMLDAQLLELFKQGRLPL